MTSAETASLKDELDHHAAWAYEAARSEGSTPDDARDHALDIAEAVLARTFPGVTVRWDREALKVVEVAGEPESEAA